MEYSIDKTRYLDGKPLVQYFQDAKDPPMPKMNMKIRKSDLRIIDSVASQSGTPRSHVLNTMIERILGDMLRELASDDQDCAALVALHADQACGANYEARGSWSDQVFDGPNHDLFGYYHVFLPDRTAMDFSEQYSILEERLSREME